MVKFFSEYQPSYFSRLMKSTKSTYFRKIASHPIDINFISIGLRSWEKSRLN